MLGPVVALTVLYRACGYSMRYRARISVLNYLRQSSDHGIPVKDGRALELLGIADTFVFDKSSTLTVSRCSRIGWSAISRSMPPAVVGNIGVPGGEFRASGDARL